MNQRTTSFTGFAALLLTTALLLPIRGAAAPAPLPQARRSVVPSTRDLFHFRRDDAAPGGVTRITLDASRVAARPVSQDVFGNFVENLGTVIYDILWADALHNGDLERIEKTDPEPQWWDGTGSDAWLESPGSGYLSPSSVRLSGPDSTLSQRVYLPATRVRGYTLTLWTRAPAGDGRVTLAVRAGGEKGGPFRPGLETAGRPVVSSTVDVPGPAWQKQTVRWTLPEGAIARGQAARFVISSAGGGAVDVDRVSLFPDDAQDGMDPDVLRAARAWHIPVLRFAGNYSSGYRWREGVGPQEARPTTRNVAWGGPDSHAFGTDEFLDLAARLGATAQIGANAGDGTPAEAAAWVRYCNSSPLTNGTRRVPLWEIGNELYGGWQIGHTDAAGNAARFVAFRAAMKQADPTIEIMATGKGDEFGPKGLDRDNAWNLAVLNAALVGGSPAPDYLTLHPLVGLPGSLRGLPYGLEWESAMAHPAFLDQTELPELIQDITRAEGPDGKTRLAPTEWGIIIDGAGWQQGPNHDVTSGAIYNALALNTFLRRSDWVTLANMTALLHGGCIKKSRGVLYVTPEYYTSQLYAAARPRTPVAADWAGPGRDVPARGFLPAAADVPDVDVFSALSADPKTLVAFLVNRDLMAARPVHLSLAGFAARTVTATVLTSADPQAANSWDHPDNVRPQPFALPKLTSSGLDLTLPPHTLVVLTFRRPGEAVVAPPRRVRKRIAIHGVDLGSESWRLIPTLKNKR